MLSAMALRSPASVLSGRLLGAVVAVMVVGVLIGSPLAFVLIDVARRRHWGCDAIFFDGRVDYVCPDGLGYVFPAVMVIGGAAAIAAGPTVWALTRGLDAATCARCGKAVGSTCGCILLAQTAITVPVGAVEASYLGTSLIWVGLVAAAGGAAILGCYRLPAQYRRWVVPITHLSAAATLGASSLKPGIFLLGPPLLVIAAALTVAVALHRTLPAPSAVR